MTAMDGSMPGSHDGHMVPYTVQDGHMVPYTVQDGRIASLQGPGRPYSLITGSRAYSSTADESAKTGTQVTPRRCQSTAGTLDTAIYRVQTAIYRVQTAITGPDGYNGSQIVAIMSDRHQGWPLRQIP